jgi:hypothetical protein
MEIPNYLKASPRRAPNWRWLRAVQIDAGGKRATRVLDGAEGFAWIRRLVRLKRHYERANRSQDAVYALMLRDHDLFWAHSMWVDEKAPTRWGIEARVLAGETDEEIAAKLGTEPGVITAYVNAFFDVREKLNNSDYVINVVMADAVTRGLQERHYDLLWKMLAYQGGPFVIDSVINRFISIGRPDSSNGVAGFFQDAAINSMKYKAALATMTVQINTHTQLPLIDSFVKYVEIERTTDSASKAQSSIIDNIGAMLAAMPVKVGTKLDSAAVKMLPFDNNAAELRGDEMLIIASGGALENTADLQTLNFPGEQ